MREPEETTRHDVCVIGAGGAGLYVALQAADLGARVCLLSRKPLDRTASYWAQGGLAAALDAGDTPELHAEDTLRAGRGACRRAAVEILCRGAPEIVADLSRRGVRFDADRNGVLALGLEGGHSQRRVVHAGGSATGRRITRQLSALVANHPRIDVREGTSALALASDGTRCSGAITDAGTVRATATVLATGGSAALWRRTSNPRGAIGAGVVLAHAAGADLADLELCQFHPTALALPGHPRDGFLVTEAIRGEGATLHGAGGDRFCDELAPRDEVTAAVLDRMAADGSDHVQLDMRALEASRFPNIVRALRDAGIDPTRDHVPVAPAAHYVIGGVAVDLDGRSSLAGLYAVGECSASGLHGANRLASNSLTECFVFGARAAHQAIAEPPPAASTSAPDPGWRFEPPTEATRVAMWEHAGPLRDRSGLERLREDPYPLARLGARLALERRETRGGHRRRDHPAQDPAFDAVHLVLGANGELRREHWE